MSEKYIPLYRKYRPQTFHDLIGQENIVAALTNAVKMKRISHAYLLCGPRGTGKTSSARILAKSLNCAEGPTLNPCGKCPACLDVMNSIPVDVIEIDAASNRSVEDTQAILEKIQYVPVNGKYKIYVIDEVHMLSAAAFNSLLKTLEEPPENVIFILATTEPHKVLDTIISRCQRFDFRRITSDDIVKRLKYIAEQEKINISDDALRTAAKNAQGGMRDALSLLDQISVLSADRQITADDVNELLGRISCDKLNEIAECIAESDCSKSVNLINEVYEKGNEPVQLLNNMTQYFRDLMILKNCSDKELVYNLTRINEEIYDKCKSSADKFTSAEIIQIIDKLSYYTAQTRDSSDKYLRLELCIIELANYKNLPSPESLMRRIEALENALSAQGTPASHNAAAAFNSEQYKNPAPAYKQPACADVNLKPADTNPVQRQAPAEVKPAEIKPQYSAPAVKPETFSAAESTGQNLHNTWVSIMHSITSTTAKAYFQRALPVEISKKRILIAFANDMFLKMADKNKKQALADAVTAYTGIQNPNIEIIKQTEIPKDLKPASDAAAPQTQNTAAEKQSAAPVYQSEPSEMPKDETDSLKKQEEEEYQNYLQSKNDMPAKTAPSNQKQQDVSSQAAMLIEMFDGRLITE